jgi:zinc protease
MPRPDARNLMAVVLCAFAGSLFSQTATTASPSARTQNSQSDPVTVRDANTLPSWKDLRFPTLGAVKIPKPEIFTLSNGMKVYLLENHELPLVSGRALVRTGNLFDPKDKLGLAEITGIVIRSGGTSKLTGDQLDEKLENMAASVETDIGESSGSASFSCLRENTDTVLGLFHDVISDPEFRADKIELAKTQERSSISRRNDNPGGIAQRELYRMVYGPDTPYGGELEYDTVNAIQRDDVVAFYQRYFFPANIIFAVYGDFDSASMKQKIESVFSQWTVSKPKVPPFPKVDAPPTPGIYLISKSDVTQTFIEMGHLGGELRDKDFPALSVAADVFGGGFSSRLFREIRTRLGYAYAVGADWGSNYDHPGVFRIGVSTKTETTTETIRAILKVLDEIRASEITDEELKVSKDSVLNSLVFAFERPVSTLNRLVTYDYFGYPADFLTRYQKALEGVTKQDVLRVAKQYFQPSKLATIAVANEKNLGEPLTALNLSVKPLDVSIRPPHEIAAIATPQSQAAGSALLAKAITFLGGAEKLASLHDITRIETAQLDTPQGQMDLKVTSRGILPDTFREEQQRGPMTITLFIDSKSAWVKSPQGTQNLPAEAQQQIRSQIARQLSVLMPQLPKLASNAVAVATDKVQIKPDGSQALTLEIDSSGEVKSLSYTGEAGQETEKFSDWRDVGGLKFPFKSETVKKGKTAQTGTISELKINTKLSSEELSKQP